MKILPVYFWTRKSPLIFRSHLDLAPDFRRNSYHCGIGIFQHYLLINQEVVDKILVIFGGVGCLGSKR